MSFLRVSSGEAVSYTKPSSKAFQLNEAEFEDDPYMAEKVKSLKAAQKLEEQFQSKFRFRMMVMDHCLPPHKHQKTHIKVLHGCGKRLRRKI